MKIKLVWFFLFILILLTWLPMLLGPATGMNPEVFPVTTDTQIALNFIATLGALLLGLLFTWISRKK